MLLAYTLCHGEMGLETVQNRKIKQNKNRNPYTKIIIMFPYNHYHNISTFVIYQEARDS